MVTQTSNSDDTYYLSTGDNDVMLLARYVESNSVKPSDDFIYSLRV